MFSIFLSFVKAGFNPEPFIGEWGLYTPENLNTSTYTIELHYRDASRTSVSGSLWHDGMLYPDLSSKAVNPMMLQFDVQIKEHVVQVISLPNNQIIERFQIMKNDPSVILKGQFFTLSKDNKPNYAIKDFVSKKDYLAKPIPNYPWSKPAPETFVGLPLEEEKTPLYLKLLLIGFAVAILAICFFVIIKITLSSNKENKNEENEKENEKDKDNSKENTKKGENQNKPQKNNNKNKKKKD